MRLLLITLTCLSACLALPHERQARGILPGDPRYGTDYHQHHHHHPETVVEAAKSIGYSYNIPDAPITLPQFNYGPPGYQPGFPLNNDYLSPIVDTARYSLPVSTYGAADYAHIPQLTKTVVGPSALGVKTISSPVAPLPLQNIKTVTVSPPATSYGTPVVDVLRTSFGTGSHHALKTLQTAPATRVTLKDVPSFTATATKSVIGNNLVSEGLPGFHSLLEGINLPSYNIGSYAPSTYASYQPVIQSSIPAGFSGLGLKSVHVDAPLTSVGVAKSIPTTYPLPQAVELPRATLHAPHSLTHLVQRTQPLHTLQSVQPLPTVHSVQPLPTVHSVPTVYPVPTVHSVPTVHTLPAIKSVKTVTPLPTVHSVKTVSPLPSLPSVHSLEAVTPLPHLPSAHSYEAVTPLPQLHSAHSYEAVTPLPHLPSAHSYEAVTPLPQLHSAHSYEAVTPLPQLHSAHSYEAVTSLPQLHSAHSYEAVTSLPQLHSGHSFEAVTPVPDLSSVHSVSTVSPLPHHASLHSVDTVSHLPLEPAHHLDTVHPSHSVEILPPVESLEHGHSVHDIVHSKTNNLFQRGPITDFIQTVSQNLPSFPSLPSLPSLPSFPSLPGFPVQSSTVSPAKLAGPLNLHVSDSISRDSITVDNPLLRPDSLLDTSIEQHITPSNGYIQPTDINGGYIY